MSSTFGVCYVGAHLFSSEPPPSSWRTSKWKMYQICPSFWNRSPSGHNRTANKKCEEGRKGGMARGLANGPKVISSFFFPVPSEVYFLFLSLGNYFRAENTTAAFWGKGRGGNIFHQCAKFARFQLCFHPPLGGHWWLRDWAELWRGKRIELIIFYEFFPRDKLPEI